MKKVLIFLVLCAALCGGGFLYLTRPVSAPSVQTPETNTPVVTEPVASDKQVFVISSEKSEAKFEINEVLSGAPFRVKGTTTNVEGSITIDPKNPSESSVSTIKINARTLKTDSTRRDGAIGRMILKSEANEFITFVPESVSGLPETFELGKEYSFKAIGALTVAGTAKDVTFDVKAKASSETEIQGVATSSIDYNDFSLTIPKVPMVASVEGQVDLTFTFVAEKK